MAKGGGVQSRCQANEAHDPGCEYFADGGVSGPAFEDTDPVEPSPTQAVSTPPAFEDTEPIAQSTSAPPAFEDTEPIPEPDQDKYSNPLEQAKAGLEGAAEGVAGPLATLAETSLGVDPKDITGRAEANPWTHGIAKAAGFVGGMTTGVGEAALLAKIPMIQRAGMLGKVGSMALKGMIDGGILQAGDETTKALLGTGGDPSEIVSHLLAAGAVGALTGGLFSVAGQTGAKALRTIEDTKLSQNLRQMSYGIGLARQLHSGEITPEAYEELSPILGKHAKQGIELYNSSISKPGKMVAEGVADTLGAAIAGAPGAIFASKTLAPLIGKVIDRPMAASMKYIAPTLTKYLVEGLPTNSVTGLIDYATKVGRGQTMMGKGVDSLFKTGAQQIYEINEKDKKKIQDWMENGDLDSQLNQPEAQNQPQMAEGGDPGQANQNHDPGQANQNHDPVLTMYPDQASVMGGVKQRVSSYLKTVKPQPPVSKLPYDRVVEDPMAKKHYDQALGIAVQPLSVINKIKSGTLQPDDMKHLVGMYPELYSQMSKKITEGITKNQMEEEKPSYRIRQSLSLFLGTPLDTSMTPASIQAAQMVFLPKPRPQSSVQSQPKLKKSTSSLGKESKSYRTTSQAAEADRSSR